MWGLIMCDCHSYNADTGTSKEVILVYPWNKEINVCVDSCIADVIELLWENNINTQNSCCGHNKITPWIIFDENSLSAEKAVEIREIISQVDKRDFDLLCWERVTY